MSVAQVEALERGEYAKLPRGPFLRGFVRNYAKIVGVPADDLLASLADAGPRDPAPRIVVPSQNIRFDPLSERMSSPYMKAGALAAFVMAIGFGAMYWWLFVRTAPPAVQAHKAPEAATKAPVAASAPAPRPAAPPPVVAEETPPPVKPPVVPAATPEPPKPAAAKAPDPEKPAPVAVPAATVGALVSGEPGPTLKFRFKGRSWVEIRDARGKVLLSGLNDAGSETAVSGVPPFRVVVGNAPEVKMFYNDREYGLEPYMREAVARLTVE
jgi:cytoskeleton protein RodZ